MVILAAPHRISQIHARKLERPRHHRMYVALYFKTRQSLLISSFPPKTTFIAAVQAQVITYANETLSTRLEITANAFFFAGLFLDILGGCAAYMAAVQLQRIYTLLLRRTASVSAITNALEQYTFPPTEAPTLADLSLLCLHVRFLEVMFLHALSNPPAWRSTLLKVQEARRSVEDITRRLDKRLHARVCIPLQEYQSTTTELDLSKSEVSMAFSATLALPIVVFMAVACLVVGGLCHVKDAQPVVVWVTSFVVVGGVLFLFLVMTVRSLLMFGTLLIRN